MRINCAEMKKELIFMGRANGVVRLALFNPADGGIVRKLPVKEVSEQVFIDGIKSGSLPVRGFGINKGRITSEYGSWYHTPEVKENGFSLFGTVYFGDEMADMSNDKMGSDFRDFTRCASYFGVASVEWNTGIFRVLFPTIAVNLGGCIKDCTVYQYNEITRESRLRYSTDKTSDTASGDGREINCDYVFETCERVESIADICSLFNLKDSTWPCLAQWSYQCCEHFNVRAAWETNIKLAKQGKMYADSVVYVCLYGKQTIDVVDVPANVRILFVRRGREIKRVNFTGAGVFRLFGVENAEIVCPKVDELHLAVRTDSVKAKLLREPTDRSIKVYNWNGWDDSGGDYRNLAIEMLDACFQDMVNQQPIKLDVRTVCHCFNAYVGDVEFSKQVDSITYSFEGFIGKLVWHGADRLIQSFNNCRFKSGLDLRNVNDLSGSVNDIKDDIFLPDRFECVGGEVFKDTGIPFIKSGVYYDLRIDSPGLHLEAYFGELEAPHRYEVTKLDVGRLVIHTVEDLAPKFAVANIPPITVAEGCTKFGVEQFKGVMDEILDLSPFTGVSYIPERCILSCFCSSVIFGDGVKSIEAKAIAECDNLRWVYIPETVETVGKLIFRPRAAYTIYTQKGSAADKFGQANGIEVRYVNDKAEFKRSIQAVPDELVGAVAVATLTGEGDGNAAAAKLACAKVDYSSDLGTVFKIKEHCDIGIDEVNWYDTYSALRYEIRGANYPRMQVLTSYLSEYAPFNARVSMVKENNVCDITRFVFGDYELVCATIISENKGDDLLWLILRGDRFIHMFTERVSSKSSSSCIIKAALSMQSLDANGERPSDYAPVLMHTTFSSRLAYVNGVQIGEVTKAVKDAVSNTFVPLGVYKFKSGKRAMVCVDIVNLTYWAFNIVAGKSFDRDIHKTPLWTELFYVIGDAVQLESIDSKEMVRCYSDFSSSDAVLTAAIGTLAGTEKIKDYDTKLPVSEIEACEKILKVMKAYSDGLEAYRTVKEFGEDLVGCGLGSVIAPVAWAKKVARSYRNSVGEKECTILLRDGKCDVFSAYPVTYFVLNDGSKEYAVACLIPHKELDVIEDMFGVWNELNDIDPNENIDHFSLTDKCLPESDFAMIRLFSSCGEWIGGVSGYNVKACIALSRISGKICVGAAVAEHIMPVFWTNSVSDAVKIAELGGFKPFNDTQESVHSRYRTPLVNEVFANERDIYELRASFASYNTVWGLTRQAIQRGETGSYVCLRENQVLFDLAMKQPPKAEV